MTITPVGPTLGYTIGFPVMIIISSIFFLIALAGLLYRISGAGEDDYYAADYFGAWAAVTLGVVGLLATLAISAVAFWPLHSDYHTRYRVQGTVTAVGSRQIADGSSMSTRYVFTIGGKPFGVDDTRAALTKPGDTVNLVCTKEYTYGAAFGWACDWGAEP